MSYLHHAPWGVVCLCLFTAAVSLPAVAGVPVTKAPPAVRDALLRLRDSSPQVEAADATVEAARARSRAAALPLYNPSLAVEGENADVDRRTIGVSLPLDLSGKRRSRIVESDAAVRTAQAQRELQWRDVASRWLKAWTSATWTARQSALGRRRVALMQRFDELAARRLSVGDIATSERDLAALALADAHIRQATLAGQEASSLGLLAALGQGTSLPAPIDGMPPPAGIAVPRRVDERPGMRLATAEQARAQAAIAVADRARRPDPTLSLTGGRVRSGARTDQVVGIAVSMPLPIANNGRADVAAAMADADAATAAQRTARMEADAALEQARLTYESLRLVSEGLRDSRVDGADGFDARADGLERLWQASELSTPDYLVQLNQSLDTAQSGLALQMQLWLAWFDYLAAAGRLDDWIDGSLGESGR
ncbi:TolC family protein [Luteibacter rhizovicinus]|uniref:TolC family protein n=1 Tax=Luteibacter rhizovicinus TaxID=242606 RepID=UPI000659608C|nr:TolC family protein [Luteibacter rhizovicinus]KLD68043.1 transporter [Luteibacter rhizovicinus DSM 16549]